MQLKQSRSLHSSICRTSRISIPRSRRNTSVWQLILQRVFFQQQKTNLKKHKWKVVWIKNSSCTADKCGTMLTDSLSSQMSPDLSRCVFLILGGYFEAYLTFRCLIVWIAPLLILIPTNMIIFSCFYSSFLSFLFLILLFIFFYSWSSSFDSSSSCFSFFHLDFFVPDFLNWN